MAWSQHFNFATQKACKICTNMEFCAYEKLGFVDNSYYVIGRKYKSDGEELNIWFTSAWVFTMQGFLNSVSDENLRKEDKYRSIFAYKFTVGCHTKKRPCLAVPLFYQLNFLLYKCSCTLHNPALFLQIKHWILYFSLTWDSLYTFSILIYFVNPWIVNKQNSLSEWMWQLKIPGCKYTEERVNVEAYVKNYMLRKCLERVCDFTCFVFWTVLCPRISDADKIKKSCQWPKWWD